MDRADELLFALADGEPRSGQRLGEALGVTRAAVWKLVRQLQEQGVPLVSEQGRGYRLTVPLELLRERLIRSRLSPDNARSLQAVDVVRVTDSTNRQLFKQLPDLEHPRALFAEAQTAGRGRRGRTWHSPFGRNLYLSLAWPFHDVPGGMAGLSLAAGISVAAVLRRFGVTGLSLKWPNDLVVDGAKLGGLLVELQGEPAGPCAVVLGLGLNLDMEHAGTDAAAIDQQWVAVRECLSDWPGRNTIAAGVLDGMVTGMRQFAAQGFSVFLPQWPGYDALAGRDVRLLLGERELHGRACGVDPTGCLLLDQGHGPEPWGAGEVSVRPVS